MSDGFAAVLSRIGARQADRIVVMAGEGEQRPRPRPELAGCDLVLCERGARVPDGGPSFGALVGGMHALEGDPADIQEKCPSRDRAEETRCGILSSRADR